jgi:hypothetical protein
MKKTNGKQTIQNIFDLADIRINGNRPWDIQVQNLSFYERVLAGGSLALGETYMDGWWDCEANSFIKSWTQDWIKRLKSQSTPYGPFSRLR